MNNLPAIQGKLMTLRDESIFADTVREGSVKDLKGTLKMIIEQSRDNRESVAGMIGEELLSQIENLC